MRRILPLRELLSSGKRTAVRREGKLSIEKPLLDSRVSIDPSIAQEGPMGAMLVHARPIDFANDDFFPVNRTFGDDLAVRSANETLPPKFDSFSASRRFVANSICRSDVATVRDGMASLDSFPCIVLGGAEFLFLARMPADCRRIKNNFGPAQGGQAPRLRIPLV